MRLHMLLFVFLLNGVFGNDVECTGGIDSTTAVNFMELFKEMERKIDHYNEIERKVLLFENFESKLEKFNELEIKMELFKSYERKVNDLQIKIMENEAKHTSEIASLGEENRALHSRVDNIEHVYQVLKGQADFLKYDLKTRINENEQLKETLIPESLNTETDTENSPNVNQEDTHPTTNKASSEVTEPISNPIRELNDVVNKIATRRTVSKHKTIRRHNNRDDLIDSGRTEPSNNEKRQLSDGTVAFCATLHGSVTEQHLAINQPITYDKLVTNIGNGFHMAHGIFTAPQSGVYLMSSSVLSVYNSKVHAALVVNGVPVAQIFSSEYGGSSQGSQTIIVQLGKGDDVAVQIVEVNDVAIMGNMYTSFSGYLLAHT